MARAKKIKNRITLIVLMIGMLGSSCATTSSSLIIVLPEEPTRPQLEKEISVKALLLNEERLMRYARLWELWSVAVKELVNGSSDH